jgi:hypothetical protein
MKKLKSVVWIVIITPLLIPDNGYTQQIFGLTYDLSFPTHDTYRHVQNVSMAGFGLDARQMLSEQTSFGVSFHWNAFKDNRLEQVDNGKGSFISIDDRSLESFPLLMSTHFYFFSEADMIRPYIGTNVGTYYIIRRQNIDGVRRVDKNWHLGIAPDIGVMIEFIQDIYLMLTVRYNYAFEAGALPAQSYWGIVFGFVSIQLF